MRTSIVKSTDRNKLQLMKLDVGQIAAMHGAGVATLEDLKKAAGKP